MSTVLACLGIAIALHALWRTRTRKLAPIVDFCGATHEPPGRGYRLDVCTLEKGHAGPMHVHASPFGSAQWPMSGEKGPL